ncbi:MAG: penicillin-binding protein 2 [Candidatus Sericytochromatia bacterium]|nr:penicillin-binding protein 2 [Candidatus Sericytochromatia bacterium]
MASHQLLVRQRASWVLVGLAGAAGLLTARLIYLQLISGPSLAALAVAQRTKIVDLSSVRGEIVDRNGRALAASVEAYSVYASPRDARSFDPASTAQRLAPVLGLKQHELQAKLQGKHFRWLYRLADDRVYKKVRALKLPGVGIVRESKRIYPKGRLAATLIGFVGVDNQGLAGIEHAFDKVLRGPQQKVRVEVDAYGREIMREGSHKLLDAYLSGGSRVVLTIDENLQHVAERELGVAIKDSGARRGAIIMMDPRTGDLLAFATLPTYDPNHFGKYNWQDIKNWAVTDVYEPGSTMKCFTVAAALEHKRVTTRTVFTCPERITVDGRTVSEHDSGVGTRQLTPSDIIEVSSNVGTSQMAFRLSPAQHRRFLHRLGFGVTTGSGITGESKGVVPGLPWRRLTQATISYGQGISATPLQVLTAAAALGNGGVRMVPRLIDRVVSNKGELLETFPVKTAATCMSPATAQAVVTMMEQVVERGTGLEARVPGFWVGGKTGTAQRVRDDGFGYSDDVVASFVGLAPSKAPRFAILTLLDAPRKVHWASMTAAPLFARVAEAALRQAGVQPTRPLTPPAEPSRKLPRGE